MNKELLLRRMISVHYPLLRFNETFSDCLICAIGEAKDC